MPAALISSTVAGRRPVVAPTAFASFVSLTSWSPRTIAVTSRPSPATKKAAFAVRSSPIPRNAASVAIVVVPGVATSSRGSGSSAAGSGRGRPRDLAVRRVAARVAQDEDVLAGRVEDHELVGLAAAHDPDVARDDLRLEPESLEDPDVGALLGLVADVEAGLVAVAAVGVLHDELADADQAAPGARLVAPLRLEVVEHHRQLAIRAGRCRRGAAR